MLLTLFFLNLWPFSFPLHSDIICIQMAQRRRSSRASRGEEYDSKVRTLQSLVAFSPLMFEDQAQRIFRDIMQRMLSDFAKTMREHELAPEMTTYRMEEHLAAALQDMEAEIDVLGRFIEEKVVRPEFVARAKADLEAVKRNRREKAKGVMELALKLSESMRDARIDQLVRVLQGQVERFRLREVKNIYEYDKMKSLKDKFQKDYDDHLQKLREKHERICAKYDIKYARK